MISLGGGVCLLADFCSSLSSKSLPKTLCSEVSLLGEWSLWVRFQQYLESLPFLLPGWLLFGAGGLPLADFCRSSILFFDWSGFTWLILELLLWLITLLVWWLCRLGWRCPSLWSLWLGLLSMLWSSLVPLWLLSLRNSTDYWVLRTWYILVILTSEHFSGRWFTSCVTCQINSVLHLDSLRLSNIAFLSDIFSVCLNNDALNPLNRYRNPNL